MDARSRSGARPRILGLTPIGAHHHQTPDRGHRRSAGSQRLPVGLEAGGDVLTISRSARLGRSRAGTLSGCGFSTGSPCASCFSGAHRTVSRPRPQLRPPRSSLRWTAIPRPSSTACWHRLEAAQPRPEWHAKQEMSRCTCSSGLRSMRLTNRSNPVRRCRRKQRRAPPNASIRVQRHGEAPWNGSPTSSDSVRPARASVRCGSSCPMPGSRSPTTKAFFKTFNRTLGEPRKKSPQPHRPIATPARAAPFPTSGRADLCADRRCYSDPKRRQLERTWRRPTGGNPRPRSSQHRWRSALALYGSGAPDAMMAPARGEGDHRKFVAGAAGETRPRPLRVEQVTGGGCYRAGTSRGPSGPHSVEREVTGVHHPLEQWARDGRGMGAERGAAPATVGKRGSP
jgi:hypothetical protein